jgi:hypothetical protein
MLYESFFNGWKFSLPPLERHQWNNTYKSLPQDYMFCQMEYVCMQKWHSTTQGQRKVANSCFTKLYQMKSNKQECVQQRENLSICFKEIHKMLTSDKTSLTDSAFCMGLWIYGHTCSRLPQYWEDLSQSSQRRIALAAQALLRDSYEITTLICFAYIFARLEINPELLFFEITGWPSSTKPTFFFIASEPKSLLFFLIASSGMAVK